MATTIPVTHIPHGAPIHSAAGTRGPTSTFQQSGAALHPAGGMEQAVTKTPEELSPELQVLVDTINRLYHARTIDEHKAILKSFDDDVVVDTPLIYATGRDRLRVLATLFKSAIGHFDMQPKVLRIRMLEDKRAQVEIDNSLHIQPWRTWLFPPSLLLPRDIPVHNTITLGVKSHNDKIGLFKGRIHNIPPLPFLARWATGWGVGTAGTVLEPVYFQLLDWYRAAYDNVYSTTANIKEGARETVDRAKDTVSNTTEAVRERVQPLVERAAETVGLKSE